MPCQAAPLAKTPRVEQRTTFPNITTEKGGAGREGQRNNPSAAGEIRAQERKNSCNQHGWDWEAHHVPSAPPLLLASSKAYLGQWGSLPCALLELKIDG